MNYYLRWSHYNTLSPPRPVAFEDAEVMAAVDEIAKDPGKMIKYKDNKKVPVL